MGVSTVCEFLFYTLGAYVRTYVHAPHALYVKYDMDHATSTEKEGKEGRERGKEKEREKS